MFRPKAVVGSVVLAAIVGTVIYSTAWAQQTPTQPAPGAGAPGGPGGPGAGGRGPGGGAGGLAARGGGGRGNNPYGISGPLPGAAIYAANCQSCHGTDLNGARATTLFAEAWLSVVKDEEIISTIHNGIPGTEMASYKDKLTEDQMIELVKYMRSQSGVMKPRPAVGADPHGTVLKTEKETVKIEVVTRGLAIPWGMAFLPDGRFLVTERNLNQVGSLKIVEKDGTASQPIRGTPESFSNQDSGMFDVTIHPKYAENGWIYLSYSSRLPAAPGAAPDPAPAAGRRGRGGAIPPTMTNIVRGRIKDGQWVDQQFIYKAPEELYSVSGAHYGSRFTWDKEGHLYYSIGERAVPMEAQNLANPIGKVLRVNDDGSVPADNPFVNTPNAFGAIWTYGNRNTQGLAWDPVTGKLWESEHGPTAGDEINILKKGHNYGWGVVTKGSQDGITKTSAPGMDDPIVYYIPTFAPSGMTFYSGDKYPGWKNNLFVGGLAGQALRRLEVADETVTKQEVIFNQFGRVRNVVQGPDGYLYMCIHNAGSDTAGGTNAGMVIRLVPAQ